MGKDFFFSPLNIIYLFLATRSSYALSMRKRVTPSGFAIMLISPLPVTVSACLSSPPALCCSRWGQTAACKQIGNCQGPFNWADANSPSFYYCRQSVSVMWLVEGFPSSLTAATEFLLSEASFGQSSEHTFDICPLCHSGSCWRFRLWDDWSK